MQPQGVRLNFANAIQPLEVNTFRAKVRGDIRANLRAIQTIRRRGASGCGMRLSACASRRFMGLSWKGRDAARPLSIQLQIAGKTGRNSCPTDSDFRKKFAGCLGKRAARHL